MRSRRSLLFRALALGFVAAMLAASCSSDSDGGDDGGSSGGSGALDGVSVTIGSKDFTENILLGEMLAQALEHEGADVDNQTNLGGTQVNRKALTEGDIDVYPDYNGTGWTEHLGQEDPSQDPDELFTAVAEMDLAENDIAWVGKSPFNDTYGFAANGDLASDEGGFTLESMAAYLEANPDATLCLETEFPDRSDGLVLFEEEYGYEVPEDQITILDTGVIYTQTAAGDCDFGEIFTTDGRIEELNIELVEDPGVFILYNASFTWNNEHYTANAETYDEIADTIFAGLDEETMTALNYQVDIEGESASDVAQQYLTDIGLL